MAGRSCFGEKGRTDYACRKVGKCSKKVQEAGGGGVRRKLNKTERLPCILKGIEPASDKHPCIGYQKSNKDDEPCEMCKGCKWCDGEEAEEG